MSETERGECRARGALANLIATMESNFDREGRSETYKNSFWKEFEQAAIDFVILGKVG